MAGLMDIGPLSEDVAIGKHELTVYGLTAEDIFYLLFTYPDLQELARKQGAKLTAKSVMEVGPQILAVIIAYGTHEQGNKKAIEKARKELPAAAQLKIISAIFRLTFPQGVGPFVSELTEMSRSFTVTSAESQNQTEDSPSLSASTVSAALQMDTVAAKHYRPHRAN
jgi:hypothetical protein